MAKKENRLKKMGTLKKDGNNNLVRHPSIKI